MIVGVSILSQISLDMGARTNETPQVELKNLSEGEQFPFPRGSYNPHFSVQCPVRSPQQERRIKNILNAPCQESGPTAGDQLITIPYTPTHPSLLPEPRRRSTRLTNGFSSKGPTLIYHSGSQPNSVTKSSNGQPRSSPRVSPELGSHLSKDQAPQSSSKHMTNEPQQRPSASDRDTSKRPVLNIPGYPPPDSTSTPGSDSIPPLDFNPWPHYRTKFGNLPGLNANIANNPTPEQNSSANRHNPNSSARNRPPIITPSIIASNTSSNHMRNRYMEQAGRTQNPSAVPPAHQGSSIPNLRLNHDFVPKAQPVRPAYEDFLRLAASSIPGINLPELLNQITNNPRQPIQISVPESVNARAVQHQLQRALEQAISPLSEPSNRQPDPQQVNGYDLLAQELAKQANNQRITASFPGPNNPNSPTPGLVGYPPINMHGPRPFLNSAWLVNRVNQANFHVQPVPNQVPGPSQKPPEPPTEDDMAMQDIDADVHPDEEFNEVETYADYCPSKSTIGLQHPDPVVETSSLATVEPPDITYKLKLPSKVIDRGYLSSLQLESVIYACQQHSEFMADGITRKGFLIGDGAGVGKGRTIAGIIYENYLCGRQKSIWLSVSTDLKLDAERDLKDIGAKIPVHLLGKFSYGKKINVESCVIFTTYSGLVSKSQSFRGTLGTRIGQLTSWVGPNFDGVIVFDECHKAKNISLNTNKKAQSKAAEFVLELQNRLPKARIVYASATGASETKHLGYMTRLAIWGPGTPYLGFAEFCQSIEKRGVGAMELVAVDLKMRGSYIARQLSFKTTTFRVHYAPLDEAFIKLYDDCVDMWSKALEYFSEAADSYAEERGKARSIWKCFWAAHQRFFKYLCIGAKVPSVVQIAKKALEEHKCVVIGLQSTGESKTMEALEEGDINEFISTARATFESLIDDHFPVPRGLSRRDKRHVRAHMDAYEHDTPTSEESNKSEDIPQTSYTRKISKKEQALLELAEQQRSKKRNKSIRALRAAARSTDKSRIKLVSESSDTDISNPLNDLSSEENSTKDDTSDSSYEKSSTSSSSSLPTSDDDENTDEASSSSRDTKRPRLDSPARAKRTLDSDSDSDIQITAVKKRAPDVIILSSGDEGDETEEDDKLHASSDLAKKLNFMRNDMYRMIDEIGPRLPNNTLDDLIDKLGGPSKVAEMTGRKGHVVKDSHGRVSYKNRNEIDASEVLNIAEKERFMDGERLVAIISEAASSGISLQADKRVRNTRRRVHITIELPWSADRAIQQFGRTHRSNQTSGPEYVFVISELAGEKRFASIVAKRLESLGALTHGDRRATTDTRDLSQFNIANRYATQALRFLCSYIQHDLTLAHIKPQYSGNFLRDARQAFIGAGLGQYRGNLFTVEMNQATQVNHFLNRLLGMKVHIQNAVFKLFTDYTDRLILRRKVAGLYDAGILELNSDSGKAKCDEPEDFHLKTSTGIVKCTLRNVRVERGISWEDALKLIEANSDDSRSGFYTSVNPVTKAKMVVLLIREPHGVDLFRSYKPNMGRSAKPDYYENLSNKLDKARPEKVERIWRFVYEFTDTNCVHLCFFKSCKRIEAGRRCDVGLRHRNYCILSGGILTAWPYIEKMNHEITNKLQIVRLKLETSRVIGKYWMV